MSKTVSRAGLKRCREHGPGPAIGEAVAGETSGHIDMSGFPWGTGMGSQYRSCGGSSEGGGRSEPACWLLMGICSQVSAAMPAFYHLHNIARALLIDP
jgi:hypothetical protein